MAKASNNAKATAKKRVVKVDSYGDAHVTASFNNIIVSLTNKQGQVVSWSSAGKMGFKGSKKNTPYAAQTAAQDAAKVALDAGMRKVDVFVKGPGAGREGAIRALANSGIEVVMIKDITPCHTTAAVLRKNVGYSLHELRLYRGTLNIKGHSGGYFRMCLFIIHQMGVLFILRFLPIARRN